MKEKPRKSHILTLILIPVLVVFLVMQVVACSFDVFGTKDKNKDDKLEITILDVGKADAILLRTANHTVMIDSGERDHEQGASAGFLVDYLTEQGVVALDYLIITHFDRDHVGGAAVIIENFDVKAVIVPDYRRESRHYLRFQAAMQEKGITAQVLASKATYDFYFDGVEFTVYASHQEFAEYIVHDEEEDDEDYLDRQHQDDDNDDYIAARDLPNVNNFSLVTSISHRENHFLFTADAKAARIREILATPSITEKDYVFMQIPHHGNLNRRSLEFINAIQPSFAVITCSHKRPPDVEIIDALADIGANVFLTADGNVYLESDGLRIDVSQ
ncbi:MAG: MBL fold metallo-hydrolase [Lachnospiraceae bacterium]|jgi:beta-lactamase superfamily II metal-dependent hydrolase|nr:MBL fold metallo-hydrolase [Lachnospiraceae bacterium]